MKKGKLCSYDIYIYPTENGGFIVQVGCKRFAFEGKNSLVRALKEYLNDPETKEREFGETGSTDPGAVSQEHVPEQGQELAAQRSATAIIRREEQNRE